MSDQAPPLSASSQEPKSPFNPQLPEFRDALERLYLPGNLSGRLHFAEEWPNAVGHVFGAELLRFDHEGSGDRGRIASLETEAEMRQMTLQNFMENIEDRLIEGGALNVEEVRAALDAYGRDLCVLLFSDELINRFAPAPETSPKPVSTLSAPAVIASLDDVKPIDMPEPIPDVQPQVAPDFPPKEAPVLEETLPPKKPTQSSAPQLTGLKLLNLRPSGVSYYELLQQVAQGIIELSSEFNKSAT